MRANIGWIVGLALVFATLSAPTSVAAGEPLQYFPIDAPGPEFASTPDLDPAARDDIFGHIQGTDFYVGGDFGGQGFLLFGAIGGVAAVANATNEVQERGASAGDLTRTDVRAMLRQLLPARAEGQQDYYTLIPQIGLQFTDREHFQLVCTVLAEFPIARQRAWSFSVRLDPVYDAGAADTEGAVVEQLPECLRQAYGVYSDFVARRDQVSAPTRLRIDGNSPLRRRYLVSEDGARVYLVFGPSVNSFAASAVTIESR